MVVYEEQVEMVDEMSRRLLVKQMIGWTK